MKIYLKRDKSDEKSRYIVYSESAEELYRIVGEKKAHIERSYILHNDTCVAKIRDTNLFMVRNCYVNTNENNFHIMMTSASDKMTFRFHGIDFHLRGDILNKSYDIMNIENKVVCCVSRKYLSHSDALELNIFEENNILSCIVCAMFFDSICTVDAMTLQTT